MSAADQVGSPAARELCTFIDASPTPFHVVQTVSNRLGEAGFQRLSETESWPGVDGKYFVTRGGSLVAWCLREAKREPPRFRIVGGHTDSPNLRVKQRPDFGFSDLGMVALEPYGGAWLNSWFDRDLSLAGRLVLLDGTERLISIDEPLLRVPQLAIHLAEDRKGLIPDPQLHLNALWSPTTSPLLEMVGRHAQVAVDQMAGVELMTYDAQPSRLVGADEAFVSAPRLDNQVTCFAGTIGLVDAAERDNPASPMLALFDHEEVGSASERGAQSDFLATVIERIVATAGGDRSDYHRCIAASVCASGDMAHATHPNYPDRHDALHRINLGGGPVLKVNAQLRYATDAVGAAIFARACDEAQVPLQRFENRADLPCGSTIGPLSAARTGLLTVDVGAPQLAMHSAREFMAAVDVGLYARALNAFMAPGAS